MNVPKLRFKEFDGEWEAKKLEEISEKLTRKNKELKVTNVISNSASQGLVSQRAYFEKDIANKDNIDGYYIISKGDFVYNPRISKEAPYGPISIYHDNEDGIVSPLYTCFRILKESAFPIYIYYFFKSTSWHKYIYKNGDSGARHDRVSIKDATFFKLPVKLSTLEEQKKIGTFFEVMDKKIQLQQQKIDLLQEQKKGFLQKLLPEINELIPKKRFEGFKDSWSICKIKEICKISTGKGNTQDKVEGGIYPFYVRSATIERSNDFLYDQEAVLTIGDGVGTGKVFHYVNGKYNLHQRVYRMYNFENTVLAKYFYYYFSENFYRRVMAMTAKTSVDSVRMDMIAEMDIKYPSLLEQKRIIEFFNKLDNNIKLHEKKLEILQQQKQGFMQQMFI